MAHLNATDPKGQKKEEEEIVHDPAALEEAVAAFDKFKASIHPRGMEVQP